MKRLLIISNNVISETNNNGKTILSFIDGMKDAEIAQLYFSGEVPRVEGFTYFQITDKDIIGGFINSSKRGKSRDVVFDNSQVDDFSIRNKVGRNDVTLIIRDILWIIHWKSKQLEEWLDAFMPQAIFFVAGDGLFPYVICNSIKRKYNSRLTVYVTDDYIMPIKNEKVLHKIRRKKIYESLKSTLSIADSFYTVSKMMHDAYIKELGYDSYIAFNMTEDLYDPVKNDRDEIYLIYTGSLYYKRDEIIGELAKEISNLNQNNPIQAKLIVYSNYEPTEKQKKKFLIDEVSFFGGSLNKTDLKKVLNKADILVFVESFDIKHIEKIKYSISTKVSEYMSVGKPIFAIGPNNVGSMKYLSDIAICCNRSELIKNKLEIILNDVKIREEYGNKARIKFLKDFNKRKQQEQLKIAVLGN